MNVQRMPIRGTMVSNMNNRTNDRRSVLMIVTSMLIFGTIGIFRRHIPLPSAFLAFSRGIMGGLFLLAFRALKKNTSGRLPLRQLAMFSLTGALIGINWILLFEAYNYTTVAVATLCYYMQPTIVVLLSPFVFGEKLTFKKAVCAAVAILGMVLVSGVLGGAGQNSGDLRGVLLGLGAALLYATVVILNKKTGGADPYQRTTVQLLAAGLIMVPYLLLTNGFHVDAFDLKALVLLLIVGIVHTGIAYLLYFASIEGLKAQSIAMLSYIDPASALLFSALLLHEPLGPVSALGAVMIIGSAFISEAGSD